MSNKKRPCFSVSGASYIRLRSGAWSRGISVARLVDNAINQELDRLGFSEGSGYVRDITNAIKTAVATFAPPRIK